MWKNRLLWDRLICAVLSWSLRRRQWHPTPVLLPGESHGRRSLVGCSPWGRKESDATERLHFHFLLSCTREGNGNPLQYSCLGNPRDGRAWWAAVYGVTQSRTRLKQLSSSSSKLITSAMNMNLGKLWETAKDREAWCAVVHEVTKSQTRLGSWTTRSCKRTSVLTLACRRNVKATLVY